ncbi:methionine--tRNA ligase [Paraliomyxa miuraensis]|uniref:methionine--tRNA ligase n=1 Tax=Paraliomyxa miuraensis TaxID=376150 RepID=UPI00225A567C|nr:methionine--tRNA ligase [Paraliomyxa miuraensis]MCX4243416.1 methionine--tRNA ligase [Paraliomyxa miuraensis]
MSKRVLVTAALPYANGAVHLGHMLEFIQTDVYVRARKQAGDDCVFMWADDAHGTPIETRARREGITPEALVARAYDEHRRDFDEFSIGYDIFHTTHSEENRRHAEAIFTAMEARGDVVSRDVEQLYCPHDQMFLPDRFVKGTCPKCESPDQYGDNCEKCGSTYAPTELHEPRCVVCGTAPVLRSSEHLFVPLSRHEEFLRQWLRDRAEGGHTVLQDSVRNYVMRWVDDGLRDWDISRDAPYFGFAIPGHPGKFFYVWFDAPIGYIAATDKWCADRHAGPGQCFDAYWKTTPDDTEIVHVIGKDIVYFHCLFWPAMLHAAGYTIPSRVHVHGWLTINGEKMSKSRGTFVLARTYLDHLPAEYLRYYFAAKLGGNQEDIDLSFDDFVARINADLVNKAANLASRSVKFITSRLGGTVAALPEDAAPLVARAQERLAQASGLYREFESSKAVRLAMEVAEDFNLYLTEGAPWKLAATDPGRAHAICSAGVYATQVVAAMLKPVLPGWAAAVERFLRLPTPLSFESGQPLPHGHAIGEYETLAERIKPAAIEAILEASKETMGNEANAAAAAAAAEGPAEAAAVPDYEVPALEPTVAFDRFTPIDLRVARVLACETVEGSKKLLRFTLDLGPLGQRTVFSGIARSFSEPAALVGKHVMVVANLAPRKMPFGTSEGMVLVAGDEPSLTLPLLDPQTSRPGERIT